MEWKIKKNYKWGILGLGNIAHKFARDLATLPNAHLHAVASRSQEKANYFSEKYGAEKAYDSYEKLAKDTELDIIYIATPHVSHCENTLLCLNNGQNVLCEKPFGVNAEEVDRMISMADSRGLFLMEAMWTSCLPHFQYTMDLVKQEKYGKLMSLEADFGFRADYDMSHRLFNKSLGGGSLLDVGIYPIYAALSSMGYPDEIVALASFGKTQVDHECKVIFKYDDQKTSLLRSSLVAKTPTEAIFYCERGVVKIDGQWHKPSTVTVTPYDGDPFTKDFGIKTIGYSVEAAHVMDCLDKGKKQSALMSHKITRQLIRLLDEIRDRIDLAYF